MTLSNAQVALFAAVQFHAAQLGHADPTGRTTTQVQVTADEFVAWLDENPPAATAQEVHHQLSAEMLAFMTRQAEPSGSPAGMPDADDPDRIRWLAFDHHTLTGHPTVVRTNEQGYVDGGWCQQARCTSRWRGHDAPELGAGADLRHAVREDIAWPYGTPEHSEGPTESDPLRPEVGTPEVRAKACQDCGCSLAHHHKLRCENPDCPGDCNGWRCPDHGLVLCGCTYLGGPLPADTTEEST